MRNGFARKAVFGLIVLAASASRSEAITLHAIQFPERRSVDVRLEPLAGAPRGRIEAEVTYRDGLARMDVSYEDMKPAILFAGDVTCYVMWAVTRDQAAENLGEFLVDEPKGRLEFTTGKKNFALIVTAEPFYLVSRPSGLVVFTSAPSEKKRVPSSSFEYTGLGPEPSHAMASITDISWDAETPLPLLQARKAYELATMNRAEAHSPQIYREAGQALGLANELVTKSPGSRKLLDNARRAVALSNEAINISLHRIEGIELEKRIAERRAEMDTLEQRATQAEQSASLAENQATAAREDIERLRLEAAELEEEKTGLEIGMIALRQEKATLEQDRQRLQREKSELGSRLQDALSHVAETQDTARGFVVNLPDILFDVDQATLKPEASVILAKLSGILLIIPDLSVIVEGHTDSTGSAEYNLQLSERRALSVLEFITGEGIDGERLSSVGLGMTRPVADNETPDGRRKNRRVEIIIREG